MDGLRTSQVERVIDAILAVEGGYSNHPADPGGATQYGITSAVYTYWQDFKHLAALQPIERITLAEAEQIYRELYYEPLGADRLPFPTALLLVDAAVQHGLGVATKLLQRAAGVKEDHYLGPVTLKAALVSPLWKLNAVRAHHYSTLDKYPTFGVGWQNRLAQLVARAYQL